MENALIKDFENNLINTINSYDLPIEVKRLVLHEVYDIVNDKANEQINYELSQTEVAENDESI